MGFLRSQFQTPPEKRVQTVMYVMLGLLAYFIVDLGNTQSSKQIETLQEDIRSIQNDLKTNLVLIDQISAIEKELEQLRLHETQLIQTREQRIQTLLLCQENLMMDALHGSQEERSTLVKLQAKDDGSSAALSKSVYQVDIQGTYEEILSLLERLDENPCGNHTIRWILASHDELGTTISGTLYFRLYRNIERE